MKNTDKRSLSPNESQVRFATKYKWIELINRCYEILLIIQEHLKCDLLAQWLKDPRWVEVVRVSIEGKAVVNGVG